MLICYKSTSCGPQGSFQPGDTREIDDREGAELVRGGYATDITPVREQATIAPVEHAVGAGNPIKPEIRVPRRGR